MSLLAVTVITTFSAVSSNVATTNASSDILVANWVASNAIAEARLKMVDGQLLLSNESVEMGGRRWRYEMQSTDTADPELVRVDVVVYLDDESSPTTTLLAYVSRR